MERKPFTVAVLVFFLFAGIAVVPTFSSIGSHNVQDFPQVVPAWQQVNTNGYGDPTTDEVTALEAFNGYLYAGTHNPIDPPPGPLYDGAQIFRSADGLNWTPVIEPGFGIAHDIAPTAILDFTVFNGYLYTGTGWRNASQIRRTQNGLTWAPMDLTGFSDPDNVDISALAVYSGKIYAGVRNRVTGARIYSSYTGDNNSWTEMTAPALAESRITGFAEFDGGLYAAVESPSPAQIWLSYGSDWTAVVDNGFGDNNTISTGGLAVFGGALYVGAGSEADGAQLWRTSNGANWTQAISPAFGDSNNQKVELVFVYQNQLYVSVKNVVTGMELWRSTDGSSWEQANQDGFGDSHNSSSNWSNATAVFQSHLYVGTSNIMDGGELWRMQLQCTQQCTHLPLVMRWP
ncbi:MAG TPA: hypothetical protein VLA49_15150 [Anaerolineales bacterium]|nr:hypothetical protein [Anaerolineales bacterium]